MAATSVDVRFPLHSLNSAEQVVGAKRRLHEFEHETMILDFVNAQALRLGLRSGDVVSARVKGIGDQPVQFVGYIHQLRERVRLGQAQELRLLCVGPTWVMKDAKQRVWRDVTVSDIARTLLREHKLAADIENHSVRIPQINQAGESDWAFLCRVAKKVGYVVWAEGVVVHFHSRLRGHEGRNKAAILMQYLAPHQGVKTNIWEFTPVIGDASPHPEGMKAIRQVGGVDARTGQAWSYTHNGNPAQPTRLDTSSGKFTSVESGIVADTVQEVNTLLSGKADLAMWTHRAKAEVDGYSTVTPTSVLYFDGLQGGYDGYWHVICVEHEYVDRHRYRMHVEVGTDSLGRQVGMFLPNGVVTMDENDLLTHRKVPANAILTSPAGFTATEINSSRSGPATIRWRSDRATVTVSAAEPQPRPAYVLDRINAL